MYNETNKTWFIILSYVITLYQESKVINMIDKTLPIEYQNETDYRNVPRQY